MSESNQIHPQDSDETAELKSRLEETEETLRAIQEYMVDAFVVNREHGIQVVTLNESEIPYRMMVESMNEGAVTLIPDGTIFYCNSRFGEMVQMESESLVGTPFQELIMPEEQSHFAEIFKVVGQHGTKGEFCLRQAEGPCMPVQLSIYKLGTDQMSGLAIIATDLTEHVQAQEAVRKSENLFRMIGTHSPDVIFSQDRDLRYTWIVNPAPPLSPDMVVGKTDAELLPAEEAQRLTAIKRHILETGATHQEELSLSPDGSPRWYDAIYQPLYDENQEICGVICYAREITERIQANEKIRTLASKLTLVEQEERHRISQVLHDDLQQRLFAIKAQLSFLNDYLDKDKLSPAAYLELDQIQASLSEAVAITRNLSIDLNPVVLHGEGLAEAMTWLSFRMKEQYGLHIDLEARDTFHELDHHVRMLLFQSIRELLFNVVKHAGVLEARVTLEQLDGRGRITVTDSGKGFDAPAILNSPTSAHGLLIIQDRLSLLGCRMQMNSKPGAGTQVVIELPMERIPD